LASFYTPKSITEWGAPFEPNPYLVIIIAKEDNL
jgi:hypothetical protein